MKTYLRNNGLGRIVIIGQHPMKDFIAVASGIGDDIRWISFEFFIMNYVEEKL